MKKIYLIVLAAMITTCHGQTNKNSSLAEWTIVTYMQADNNLAPYASKHVRDMQSIADTKNVNLLVNWCQPQGKIVTRFKVGHKKIINEQSVDESTNLDQEKGLVDAMQWAHQNYPAKHYMLVFWAHGTGILDIERARFRNPLSPELMPFNKPFLEIPGLETIDCRGILYNDTYRSHLTNSQLSNALKTISSDILGKKIDIVGMDACLMAMIEVAYQIKDHAQILVASQNSGPGEGWNYRTFLKKLCRQKGCLSAADLSQEIVSTFDQLYKNKYSFYTQSAIDLTTIHSVKKSIDAVANTLLTCKKINTQATKSILDQAERITVRFDTKDFIDLYTWYEGIIKIIDQSVKKERWSEQFLTSINNLVTAINHGMDNIDRAVQANSTGRLYTRCHGLSIYLPKRTYAHTSYSPTFFAQESQWKNFLQSVLGKKFNR